MKQTKKKEVQSALFLRQPEFHTGKAGEAGIAIAGLLFLMGLFGTIWGFSSCFALPVSLPVLAGWAAILCLLLTLGHRLHFADILLFVLSAALCLFLWRFQAEIVQGFLLTVNCITKAYSENSPFEFPTFLTEELNASEEMRCATMFVGACAVPVAGALSWAVIRRKSFFLSFLFTFPFVFSALLFTITPAPGAVAFLLLFWSSMAFFSPKVHKRVGQSRFSRGSYQLPGASLLPLVLTASVIFSLSLAVSPETYRRPESVDDFRVSLETAAKEFSQRASGALRFSGSRDQAALESESPRFSGQNVLMVQSSRAAELRLRGFTGAVYNGTSWQQLPETSYAGLEAELDDVFPLNLSGYLAKDFSPELTVTIRNVGGDKRIVYTPYFLTTDASALSGVTPVHDAFLRGDFFSVPTEYSLTCLDPDRIPMPGHRGIASELYLEKAEWGDDFHITVEDTLYYLYSGDGSQGSQEMVKEYYLSPLEETMLDSLPEPIRTWMEQETAYSAFVYDNYLDVPEELRRRLLETYSTGEQFTFTDLIRWVEDTVSQSGAYTLSAPRTPDGEDFVEYFLFESHEGYCVHFASSAVMMLRSFGIPARYVEGFVVSAEELADAGPDGWVSVPDTRSHAWAEAYCPGLGWVPVEATPGSGIEQILEPEESEAVSSEPESEPGSEPEESHESVSSQPAVFSHPASSAPVSRVEESAHGSAAVWRVLLVIACVVLAFGFVILFFVLRRSLREKRFRQLPPSRAVTLMYRRALYAVRFGAVMDPRLRQLAEKAKFSRSGVTEEERREAKALLTAFFQSTVRDLPLWKRILFFLCTF